MASNDIMVRPAKNQIVIQGEDTTFYASHGSKSTDSRLRRAQAFVLRACASSSVTWPSRFHEVDAPSDVDPDGTLAIEPKFNMNTVPVWPKPQIVKSVCGKIRIENATRAPIRVHIHEHICHARDSVPNYPHNVEGSFTRSQLTFLVYAFQ